MFTIKSYTIKEVESYSIYDAKKEPALEKYQNFWKLMHNIIKLEKKENLEVYERLLPYNKEEIYNLILLGNYITLKELRYDAKNESELINFLKLHDFKKLTERLDNFMKIEKSNVSNEKKHNYNFDFKNRKKNSI